MQAVIVQGALMQAIVMRGVTKIGAIHPSDTL
jgi:hypothetical protein